MNNTRFVAAFLIAIFILIIGAVAGCDSATQEGDEPIDRCNFVASKTANAYAQGSGADTSRKYEEVLRLCTMRPGKEINEAGLAYLTCVEQASHGAAILSCEYKLEKQLKDDKLEEFEDKAVALMKDVCSNVDVDLESDPRMKEINTLETDAKALGAMPDEIDIIMEKVKVKANCK